MPEAGFTPSTTHEAVLPAAAGPAGDASVALEIYRPVGGYAQYGLLGARLGSRSDPGLLLRVYESSGRGDRQYVGSLAQRVDDVRVGLPAEFASPVFEAARSEAANVLPPGVLEIDRAAYGSVGSSPRLFSWSCVLLVRLLARRMDESSAVAFIVERFGVVDAY
jgi:hypothetical protein